MLALQGRHADFVLSIRPSQISVWSVTLQPLEEFSDILAQIITSLRQCSEPNNHEPWLKVKITPDAQLSHSSTLCPTYRGRFMLLHKKNKCLVFILFYIDIHFQMGDEKFLIFTPTIVKICCIIKLSLKYLENHLKFK